VGRRPATRNVLSFEGTLLPPREAVLETSFVFEALVRTQPKHPECRTFLEAMASAGTRVVFNRFLHAELWEAGFKTALKEKHGRRFAQKRHDGRTLRRAKSLREEIEVAWAAAVSAFDYVVVELEEVEPWLPTVMGFGLQSYDAIHVGTALFANVNAMVTKDCHFSLVPPAQLELWVLRGQLAYCRRQRRSR
jgi:predicted nucleic acid-binding protein